MQPGKQRLLFGMGCILADSTPKTTEKCSRVLAAGMTPRIVFLSLLAINEVLKGREPRELPTVATRRLRSANALNSPVVFHVF